MTTLLPSVDTVVRQFIPVVLEATGSLDNAEKLRQLEPVVNLQSVKLACKALSSISHHDPIWIFTIDDLIFWTESAVWAAFRNDSYLFTTSINKAHTILKDGLDILQKETLPN